MIFTMKLSKDEVGAIASCIDSLHDNEGDKGSSEGVAVDWSLATKDKLAAQSEGGVFEFNENDMAVISYCCETWSIDNGDESDDEDSKELETGRSVVARLKDLTFVIPDA